MSAPCPAPLWSFVFSHLPEVLGGIRWDASTLTYVGDVDGEEYRMSEIEPWAMTFVSGRRVDYIDWLAGRKGKSRAEIVAIFQRARDVMEPPAAPASASAESWGGPSEEAQQYADGNRAGEAHGTMNGSGAASRAGKE